MKSNDLLDMIGNVDDGLIAEAKNGKRSPIARWAKWVAAAACLCLVAGILFHYTIAKKHNENHVQTWNAAYTAADYFLYADAGEAQSASDGLMASIHQEFGERWDFSDNRSLMEENGAIPHMESHPLFYANADYYEDGSIYSVVLSWHRRDLKGIDNYSDLSVIAGYEEVPIIKDCIFVEIDENGKVLEPAATVTERDGVQIIARGRANQEKTITFQNETGWYQITGSWKDSYEDVVALFEWFWNHPLDFSQFQQGKGALYTYTSLKEMPDAFSDSLPNFSSFGWICESSAIILKNGQPTALEAIYVSDTTKDQAENGAPLIDWYLKAEPDVYDLEGCIGELKSITKDQILQLTPPDSITTQTKIQLRQGNYVLIIYATDISQAWQLIESIQ
ncbi:MAG: hypothetical protein E7295_02300 [Lachnospiraceae bacterium]|nr:hypothetical protein [Lachnospiraceae bacterium]